MHEWQMWLICLMQASNRVWISLNRISTRIVWTVLHVLSSLQQPEKLS